MNDALHMTEHAVDRILIEVAVRQFGVAGFEGASTRAIAAAAGKPMSAITYHFGGKQGLYLAAARHIADMLKDRLALADIERTATDFSDPDAIRTAFQQLLDAGVAIAIDPEMDDAALFITREQAQPTEAFAIIYEAVMEPLLNRLFMLLRAAAPDASPEQLRLRATMLVGQILMFRFCRAAALRFMRWDGMADAERAQIMASAQATLRIILADLDQDVTA